MNNRLDRSLNGGDEVLPVELGGVAGEVSVEVHEHEEGVHGDVGIRVAALLQEKKRNLGFPYGHKNTRADLCMLKWYYVESTLFKSVIAFLVLSTNTTTFACCSGRN